MNDDKLYFWSVYYPSKLLDTAKERVRHLLSAYLGRESLSPTSEMVVEDLSKDSPREGWSILRASCHAKKAL